MSFREEHELFRATLKRFVQKEISPYINEWEQLGKIPRELFLRMGELGFLGVEYPVEYGGAGSDFWMSIVLAEEMARCGAGGVAFSVLVHTDMSSPWLNSLGTDKQKAQYLPGITSGRTVCALAITEPDAGSDMAGITTQARLENGHWIISGVKTFTTNGVYGDLYFVAARTSEGNKRHQGISQFLVEREMDGLKISKKLEKTGMHSSDTAELVLDQVKVPVENLIGNEGKGFYQLANGLQRERLVAATLSVSAAENALETTISYMKIRKSFGKSISRFQALRHKIADLATQIEAAKRITYHAAEKFQSGEECVRIVSMAKLFATEVANKIAYETVQLHGGYGYMKETQIERYARDYRLWTIAAGSSEIMREIIAKEVLN